MENISLLVAFGAGLLSFLSPCVIPIVPVYLASLSGPDVLETGVKRARLPVFLHALSFVIGFSVVFIALGTAAGLAGLAISFGLTALRQVSGSLLIFFGLYILAATKIRWLNYEKRLNPSLGATTGYLRSFLTGSIFSVAWTPCVGPILGSIMALALSSATAWKGAELLAIYSLGLAIPFLAIGLAFDVARPWLKRIYRYSAAIHIIGGLLLIAIGVLILTNRLVLFLGAF
ncbi:MAG: sulfite exporter TauE/SafE family protein [Chloroflexi bacterium]|nr:sulfite exporter TauE/SafE family protein [Chloroflexota bacterium]